jgi:hypothetical protein
MAAMPEDLIRLLNEALRLPEEARAALAAELLESLDERVDERAEAEWAREIAARLAKLDRGTVKPIRWAAARQSILDR